MDSNLGATFNQSVQFELLYTRMCVCMFSHLDIDVVRSTNYDVGNMKLHPNHK